MSMSRRQIVFTKPRFLIAVAAVMTAAMALPAWASLGGDVTSVQADQLHMQGTRRTTAAAAYTVHEIQAANGTVVREFVASNGKVFAVAWHGPWMPDLHQLLGTYFDQFVQARQSESNARPGRRPVKVEQPGLVVENGGHLRAFSGRAYAPDMLPAGVTVGDIQ